MGVGRYIPSTDGKSVVDTITGDVRALEVLAKATIEKDAERAKPKKSQQEIEAAVEAMQDREIAGLKGDLATVTAKIYSTQATIEQAKAKLVDLGAKEQELLAIASAQATTSRTTSPATVTTSAVPSPSGALTAADISVARQMRNSVDDVAALKSREALRAHAVSQLSAAELAIARQFGNQPEYVAALKARESETAAAARHLTATEIEVCKALGNSPVEFLKARQAERARK